MRIGIDVGGTNTDAVLLEGAKLVAQAKRPTTADVTSGIFDSLKAVLDSGPPGASIEAVMLGTTHFTNALLEHKSLSPTATLRLCLPATTLLPPLIDWPDELREAIGGHTYMVRGGHEFDGREISETDPEEIRRAARDMLDKGVRAVAVSGVFSPRGHLPRAAGGGHHQRRGAPSQGNAVIGHRPRRHTGTGERRHPELLPGGNGGAHHPRHPGRRQVAGAGRSPVPQPERRHSDGRRIRRALPVFTIASGPTNSMRGAAFLSGVRDGIVIDVGGTSTDGGALVGGFPREASIAVNVAGVRTNFRMPDVFSIALGGGSIIQSDPLSIGPQSVGYRLVEEGLVFGGSTRTATDVAVAAGLADIGDTSAAGSLDKSLVMKPWPKSRASWRTWSTS